MLIMLVLTRRRNDRILIGRDVEVVVVRTRGKDVRLGIRAPEDVVVQRAELTELGRLSPRHEDTKLLGGAAAQRIEQEVTE
jgi:carbon storage regulator